MRVAVVSDVLKQKEQAAGATDDDTRARAAERVAAILAMVANPFEYDLLARKAATLLGVGEELLRRESRKRGPARGKHPTGSTAAQGTAQTPPHPFRPEAAVQATIGLIAISLYFPDPMPQFRKKVAEFVHPPQTKGDSLPWVCGRGSNEWHWDSRFAIVPSRDMA